MNRIKIIAITLVLTTLCAVGFTVTGASAQTACNGCSSPNGGGACFGPGATFCAGGGGCFLGSPAGPICGGRGALLECTLYNGTTYGWRQVGHC
jgi:hypothetical protein